MKTLWKKDSKGKYRIWTVSTNESLLIQESGLENGKLVKHEKKCNSKNYNKSNETTPSQQAISEMKSLITAKLSEGYFLTKTEAENINKEFRPMKGLVWADQKVKPKFPLLGSYKMDGACAYLENGILRSFTGELWVACPHIIKDLTEFIKKYPNVILHGEFYNHKYCGKFNELMSLIRKQTPNEKDLEASKNIIEFHIHDMFDIYNKELTSLDRLKFLKENQDLLESSSVTICTQVILKSIDDFDKFHLKAVSLGYEGTVVRPDVSYTPNKKVKGFFKRKDYQDAEFELIDFMEGVGNWTGKAKRAIVRMPNGLECGVGVIGSYEVCEDYLINKYKYIGKLATVKFLMFTPDGMLREGILKDVGRPD